MISQEKQFSKILAAIDGSAASMHAADYAIKIAVKEESQVIALHVIDLYKYPYLASSIILAPTFGAEKYAKEKKKAEEWLNTFREKYKEISGNNEVRNQNLKTEIVGGAKSAAATIVEYAESESVHLIVVGNRGRTGFKKALLGSVALDVIKYAHCPVLVVR